MVPFTMHFKPQEIVQLSEHINWIYFCVLREDLK